MKTVLLALLLGFLHCTCTVNQQTQHENSLEKSDFRGIRGNVSDAESGNGLAARIAIKDSDGNIIDSYYDKSPGFFTEEDGTFSKELPKGKYEMEVSHGIDRLSSKVEFEISVIQGVEAQIYLEPWFDLKAAGWVNGDGHCHLYTDNKPDRKWHR